MPLIVRTDLSPARWIAEQTVPWFEIVVDGPRVYPKYARLRFVPDPEFPGQKFEDLGFEQKELSEKDQVGVALGVLAEYTTTADECYYLMWQGWSNTTIGADVPAFEIPNRDYWLLRGTLAEYADWNTENWEYGYSPDPAFIWPADRAWCVTNDVDPYYATIGAPTAAIDRIVAETRIDAVVDDPENPPLFWDEML